MESPILIALIAATPPTIAALVAWRSIGKKADVIHTLVNSNMHEMQAKLMKAVGEIAELKQIISDMRTRIPRRKR